MKRFIFYIGGLLLSVELFAQTSVGPGPFQVRVIHDELPWMEKYFTPGLVGVLFGTALGFVLNWIKDSYNRYKDKTNVLHKDLILLQSQAIGKSHILIDKMDKITLFKINAEYNITMDLQSASEYRRLLQEEGDKYSKEYGEFITIITTFSGVIRKKELFTELIRQLVNFPFSNEHFTNIKKHQDSYLSHIPIESGVDKNFNKGILQPILQIMNDEIEAVSSLTFWKWLGK